ncbi:hypothetical protein QOZ80_6AG0516090 [Eleusine coracana subsp. coracana]|nr:hypothetical protein QOZ80_6AG0516090 [Eleusine coracana subsp. coracana]
MAQADEIMFIVALVGILLGFVYEVCLCCCKELGDDLESLDQMAAQPPPRPLTLPCFPYETEGGIRASEETMLCAICLDALRMGQLCSKVPACEHVFHRDCLGAWARSKGSCPLCRATIVQGSSSGVALADNMV